MTMPQWSTTAATNASAVTGVNWAEGQAPSTVNDSARQVMADVANWYGQNVSNLGLTGVGTNTITATGPAAMAAYAANQAFILTPAATNTGATTVNITPSGGSALGAKNIFFGGAACVGGELVIGIPALIVYDGTQFNIVGPYSGGLVASGQVKFPATQNPSSNANTLDDYEETDFSASVSDGSGAALTFTSVAAFATKIGGRVFFTITATYPATADGSNAQINGLPYAVSGDVTCTVMSNSAGALQAAAGVVGSGALSIYAAGSFTQRTNAQLSTIKLYFSGHYKV